jgi:hypothetical protein
MNTNVWWESFALISILKIETANIGTNISKQSAASIFNVED